MINLSRLKDKERLLIIVLAVSIAFTAYYRKCYIPQSTILDGARSSLESAELKKLSLESQLPDVAGYKATLSKKSEIYNNILQEIQAEEAKMFASADVTRLLETITKLGLDLDIKIVYIKSKEPGEKDKAYLYETYLWTFTMYQVLRIAFSMLKDLKNYPVTSKLKK